MVEPPPGAPLPGDPLPGGPDRGRTAPAGGADPASRPGRLGVGVVSGGRVGAVLGASLRAAGHAVVGASGVSERTRERVGALLPGVPLLEVPEVVRRAELVLLAVPDDALADLVAGVAATGGWQAGQLVVHTAGRYGVEVLAPARAAGAIPLAVHPAMTFTGTSLDLARLVDCSFAVTAPGPVLPVAQALVVEMGGDPVVVAEADRPLYHAALSHGANHLVTLVAQARELLAAAGVDEPARVLGPLLHASLDGAVRAGDDALTGPVARADAGTLAAHRAALAEHAARSGSTEVPDAHRAMARATALRALARGRLAAEDAARVLELLADPPPRT
ncbi:DUF2520 domain-containing protein [Pseudokineococcus sp. 5B2Z-1]|uniref:Rossmann-like and DUF2520 domain-containing protein n=1 Tax=Pseudokineococcus sp. 5B2Z-1 TaxID=3132744 RepID=UPI0030A7B41A